MGLDSADGSADGSKAEFALTLISQTLKDPKLIPSKPAARLFLDGTSPELLIAGESPIEAQVSQLLKSKADFKIIACGRAFSGVRSQVRNGKAKLIPAVEFVDNCGTERKALKNGGWLQVEIPALD